MLFCSFHTRVFHLGKNGFKVSPFDFFHPIVSSFLALILSPPQNLDAIALSLWKGNRSESTELWQSKTTVFTPCVHLHRSTGTKKPSSLSSPSSQKRASCCL